MSPVIRVFYDLDRTLYDDDRMKADVWDDLIRGGIPRERVDAAYAATAAEGFTFERHLRKLGLPENVVRSKADQFYGWFRDERFLYPDVAPEFERQGERSESILLTYGYPPYQMMKFEGLASINRRFKNRHYVWRNETKGDIIRGYGEHPQTVFVDDEPKHLEDVLRKAPCVHAVRIVRRSDAPSHQNDAHVWPVIHSLDELDKILPS